MTDVVPKWRRTAWIMLGIQSAILIALIVGAFIPNGFTAIDSESARLELSDQGGRAANLNAAQENPTSWLIFSAGTFLALSASAFGLLITRVYDRKLREGR